jgi:hypothetical protein
MKLKIFFLLLVMTLILSGCFYPSDRRVENQMPQPDQIEMVQKSVDQYREETGLIPIKNREANTPIYEKYVIDFKKMMPKYLSQLPANSFEKGGVYLYVLVNVEDDPKVKLIDLRLSKEVSRLQMRVNEYLVDNYLPIDQTIDNKAGYFTLDYKKLNLESEPTVQSPFSRQYLSFIVNQEGRVAIDYSIDLYQTLQKRENEDLTAGEDIRFILVEESFFVPVYSFPYTVIDGEPVLISE